MWHDGDPHTFTHETIPAKGRGEGIEIRIPSSIIPTNAVTYYFVWGWAHYHDVFPKTREHVVKFCNEYTGSPTHTDEISILTVDVADACANHNCADEECENK